VTRLLALLTAARPWTFAALAGVFYALSGPPYELGVLAFCAGPLLLAAIEEARTPTRAAFVAALAGFSCNVIVLGWVLGLLETFAYMPLVAALPIGVLLWAAQSLPFFAAGALTSTLSARPHDSSALASPPAWLVLPFALSASTVLVPALFPWNVGAATLPLLAYAQHAELGGIALVDLTLMLAGGGLLVAARSRSFRQARLPLLVGLLALLVPFAYGQVRIGQVRAERRAARSVRVGVVQPNIGIFQKHDPSLFYEHLGLLRSLSHDLEADGAQLVVWPETAFPFEVPREREHDAWGFRRARGADIDGPLLVGAITTEGDAQYNSALGVEADGRISGIADKVELLAFGEYTPFWDDLPILQKYFPHGITPGDAPRILTVDGNRIAVLNCYEDVLPSYARRLAAFTPAPDFFVNLTNDAWFGDTAEPLLHNRVARVRAIETRRDLVRAVNTGTSAHISATGEALIQTQTWTQTTFIADVRKLGGATPYTRFGDWLTPIGCALLLAWALRVWLARRVAARAAR
jgi:apolipoprotein N-acyltransferase